MQRSAPGGNFTWSARLVRGFVAIAALVAVTTRFGGKMGEHRAVQNLDPLVRKELYEKTRRLADTLCANPTTLELQSRCRAQLALLVELPDCDSRCRDLAGRFAAGMTASSGVGHEAPADIEVTKPPARTVDETPAT